MRARRTSAVAVCAVVLTAGVMGLRGSHRTAGAPSRPSVDRIVASIRAEPRSFNRLVARDQTSLVLTHLLHAGLIRVNRATDRLEHELAETWTLLDDQRTYRIRLRGGIRFSDGVPFTAADVAFTLRAIYDANTESVLADSLQVGGKPLEWRTEDDLTIVVRFPVPFGPGLRILDGIPILPRHKLEAALRTATLRDAWGAATPPADIVGLGPFSLREYQPGQRVLFGRNPHYFRRDDRGEAMPPIDDIVLQIVPDQDAELLALQTGAIDFTQSELRPADVPALAAAATERRISVSELGVGADGDLFWINLAARPGDRRSGWLQHASFRRAIAHAVDRSAFVDTVYLGAAVPGYGVVSPGNREWYTAAGPPDFDPAAARRLLASLGLSSAGGTLVDASLAPVRFALLTQRGNTGLERGAAVIRDSLARFGIQVDVVGLEAGALVQRLMAGDYDAAYFRLVTTDTDPALNADFWRSAGSAHVWHPSQRTPATAWEAAIDVLMTDVETSLDQAARRRAFAEIQRIMAREVPAICFAFPRLYVAMSTRVTGATPAPVRPPVLWNPAGLTVSRRTS